MHRLQICPDDSTIRVVYSTTQIQENYDIFNHSSSKKKKLVNMFFGLFPKKKVWVHFSWP